MRNNIWTTQQQVQSIKHIPKLKLQNSDIPLTKTHNNLSNKKNIQNIYLSVFTTQNFPRINNMMNFVIFNTVPRVQFAVLDEKKSKILFLPTIYVNLIFTFVSRCIWIEIIKSFKVF